MKHVSFFLLTVCLIALLFPPVANAQTDDPAPDWQAQAAALIDTSGIYGLDPALGPTPAPNFNLIQRTRLITNAYLQMYLIDPPTYQWAGIAALVACGIYNGLVASAAPAVGPFADLPDILLAGNLAIYSDLYWQHLAYQAGGIAALETAHADGLLADELLAGWQLLDEGVQTDDAEKIWMGNFALADFEQRVVLQPIVYDGHEDLWAILSTLPAVTTSVVPRHGDVFPGDTGNLADFDDRWAWVTDSLFPAWRKYSADPNNMEEYLAQFGNCTGQLWELHYLTAGVMGVTPDLPAPTDISDSAPHKILLSVQPDGVTLYGLDIATRWDAAYGDTIPATPTAELLVPAIGEERYEGEWVWAMVDIEKDFTLLQLTRTTPDRWEGTESHIVFEGGVFYTFELVPPTQAVNE